MLIAQLIPLLLHSRWFVRAWIALALLSAASLVSTCTDGLLDVPDDGRQQAAVAGAAAAASVPQPMTADDFRQLYEGPAAEVIAAGSFWP